MINDALIAFTNSNEITDIYRSEEPNSLKRFHFYSKSRKKRIQGRCELPLLVWKGVTLVSKYLVGVTQAKPGTSSMRESTTHMVSNTFNNQVEPLIVAMSLALLHTGITPTH